MSVFKLPAGFHEDYMKLIRNFWWGEDEDTRKVHWDAWDIITRKKNDGGVGFKDTRLMNQALLARQCWRIINKPESLCAKLLKSIYYPNGNFTDTVFRGDASPAWRGIEHGLELLKEGMIWRIGNGEKVDIWRDNWLPRDLNLRPRRGLSYSRLRKVKQLFLPGTNDWNEDLIRDMFYLEDADIILGINTPSQPQEDFIAWHYDHTGLFSVKSAYRAAYNIKHGTRWRAGCSSREIDNRPIWKNIWTAAVPNKVRIFGWRVARDNLATMINKCRRTLETDGKCKICGIYDEDSYHATVKCTKSRALRQEMRKFWNLPEEKDFAYTGKDWLPILLANCCKEQRGLVLMTLWRSWHLRCNVIHGNGTESISNSRDFLLNYMTCLRSC